MDALYFALPTQTSIGYGDIMIGQQLLKYL